MEELLLTQLRDKASSQESFRHAEHELARLLTYEAAKWVSTVPRTITPPPILIPILRSGLALLPAFLDFFTQASVGMIGLKRDEKTAQAHFYYANLPKISTRDHVIILDPMIATGGTACSAIEHIKEHGIPESNILFVAIIASQQGLTHVKKQFPNVTLIVPAIDEKLDAQNYIVPGLGDFGDRYFGTE